MVAAIALVLIAYRGVAFGGRTFDASSEAATVPGVNGTAQPAGVAAPRVVDRYRIDRGASSWQMIPWAQVTHRQLRAGMLPLWNPYEGAGEPLAGNLQSGVFDPLMVAVNLHPTTRTWDLSFLFIFALGSLSMYLFLRNLGLGIPAGLAGAGAFTLCGYFALHSNLTFARIPAYLPALLLLVDRVAERPSLRWAAALGLAIAVCVLAGMPEPTTLVLLTAVGYAAYRVVVGPPRPGVGGSDALARPGVGRPWLRRAALLGLAGAIGLGLAAPLLVLFFGYLPVSFNTHTTMVGRVVAQPAALLKYFMPLVNGPPLSPRVYWAPDESWTGTAVLCLSAVATSAPAALRRRGGWLLLAVAVVILAKVHGVTGTGFIATLPVFNRIDFPPFAPSVAGFCLAACAALGVDAIARGQIRWWRLAVALLVLGGILAALLAVNHPMLYGATGRLARRQYPLALGAGGAVLAATLAGMTLRRLRWVAGVLAAGAVLVELFALFPQGIYPPRVNPYHRPAWMALLTGSQVHPQARVFGLEAKLYPDTAGVFALQDIRSMNALYVKRYVTFIRQFVSPSFTDRFTGDGVTPSQIESNPAFDLLGVGYVLTATIDLASSPSAVTGTGYTPAGRAGGVQVFRNDHALPRAFVATTVVPATTLPRALAALKASGSPSGDGTTRLHLDLERQAVVESRARPPGTAPAGAPPPALRPATIVSYGPSEVRIKVPPGDPGVLVLTDAYFPGWQATVNGARAPVLPTDVAFRGVRVGRGAALVVFAYRPPGESLAWGLCFAVLVVVVASLAGLLDALLRLNASLRRARSAQIEGQSDQATDQGRETPSPATPPVAGSSGPVGSSSAD